jgi:dethiobiotin synthetase
MISSMLTSKIMSIKVFVSAIGTDSGKTLVSAILTRKWQASYWKPIQCGLPPDSGEISKLCGPGTTIFQETHFLKTPASPHFAASQEGVDIKLSDFSLPETPGSLVVEGAGGLLVPINRTQTIADLVIHLRLPLVLVVNHYLGSLNHSLLTIQELKRRQISILGIVFNGIDFQDAESIILESAQVPCLFRIQKWPEVNAEAIAAFCENLKLNAS